jgi:hypothetical protein
MSTRTHSTTNRVSFKTVITDDTTGQILAIWFSLNPRCDDDRRAIGLDLGAVMPEPDPTCQLCRCNPAPIIEDGIYYCPGCFEAYGKPWPGEEVK